MEIQELPPLMLLQLLMKPKNLHPVIPVPTNVGKNPIGIAVSNKTNMVYLANEKSGYASVINGRTNSVVGNIITNGQPKGIAVNPITNLTFPDMVQME